MTSALNVERTAGIIGPLSSIRSLRLLAMTGDMAIAAASLVAVVLVRRTVDLGFTRSVMAPEKFPLTIETIAIFCVTLGMALALSGFYDLRTDHRSRSAAGIAAMIQIALVATAWTLLARPLPRTILFGTVPFELASVLLWRRLLAMIHAHGNPALVLVGSANGIRDFLRDLGTGRSRQPVIVGTIAASPPAVDGVEYWGTIDSPAVMERIAEADEVLFVSGDDVAGQRLALLSARGARGFLLLPSAADSLLMSSTFGWIGDQPLLEISVPCGYGAAAFLKRSFDVVAGVCLAVAAAPLLLASAIAILVEDGRPALIRQWRVGRGGVTFGMWKFRTMRSDGNDDPRRLAGPGDGRITRVGRTLRRFRLDELPQIVNVLRGEMSLIGPRPEQPGINQEIIGRLPEFALRTLLRPGLTGLAQVSSGYHTCSAVKLRYDLAYMRDWSFSLDLRILMQTITTVLSGRGV